MVSKVGDRGSADVGDVVRRTTTGDLESMRSRRSSEILESLLLSRRRRCEQAEQEGQMIIEAWEEQGLDELYIIVIIVMVIVVY